jgi:hypothetical protein
MASSMSFGYSYSPGNPPFVGRRTRGAGLPDNGLLPIGRRVSSLAEEQPNLFEKSVGGRLIFQEQMILALKSDEVRTGNACSQPPPRLEWSNEITSHMHDQCRRLHFGKKIGDINISHDIEVSGCAFGRGCSALQFVKTISVFVRCSRNEKSGEHLPEAGIIHTPSEAH